MRKHVLVFAALLLAALGASAGPPPRYFVDESKLPFDEIPGIPTQRYWGVHNNAGYRIEVPQSWNGSLVLWAHGFRGEGLELTVDNHPLRPFLILNGFAWAASSYSKNRYDPAQGAKDTHALGQFFNGEVGRPKRVYLTGASMGGHVVAVMAEQWPHSYDGALPICGVLGDYELFDYFLDFNLAAQALSGINAHWPFRPDYLIATVPATRAALGLGMPPMALTPSGINFKSLVELRSGGRRPVFDDGFDFWVGHVPEEAPGFFLFGLGLGDGTLPRQPGVAVQNSDVVYELDDDPFQSSEEQTLNQQIQRVTADKQGRRINGIANVPPTTGDLRIPMLTLHTLGDLFVPFHMEQEYARRVAANSASDLLVQRATRDYDHCSFSPVEFVTAFTDLVKWVEAGIKPEGDDVLDPAVVADPNYGCKFTDRTWNDRPWHRNTTLPVPDDCPAP